MCHMQQRELTDRPCTSCPCRSTASQLSRFSQSLTASGLHRSAQPLHSCAHSTLHTAVPHAWIVQQHPLPAHCRPAASPPPPPLGLGACSLQHGCRAGIHTTTQQPQPGLQRAAAQELGRGERRLPGCADEETGCVCDSEASRLQGVARRPAPQASSPQALTTAHAPHVQSDCLLPGPCCPHSATVMASNQNSPH